MISTYLLHHKWKQIVLNNFVCILNYLWQNNVITFWTHDEYWHSLTIIILFSKQVKYPFKHREQFGTSTDTTTDYTHKYCKTKMTMIKAINIKGYFGVKSESCTLITFFFNHGLFCLWKGRHTTFAFVKDTLWHVVVCNLFYFCMFKWKRKQQH